jgi:hypothetical protein
MLRPKFRGTLSFLGNAVDRSTGTITAQATISNPTRCCLASSSTCVSTSPISPTRCRCHRSRWVQASSVGSFTSSERTKGRQGRTTHRLGRCQLWQTLVTYKGVNEGDRIIVGNLQKIRRSGSELQCSRSRPRRVCSTWSGCQFRECASSQIVLKNSHGRSQRLDRLQDTLRHVHCCIGIPRA